MMVTDCTVVFNFHASLHLHSLILPSYTDSGLGHVTYFGQWVAANLTKPLHISAYACRTLNFHEDQPGSLLEDETTHQLTVDI